MSEAQLQQKCFMWFHNSFPELRMRLYMNYNTPPSRMQGAILKGQGMVAGVADMSLLVPDGRIVFIEMKTPDGKQSAIQKEFEQVCANLQIPYYLCRSEERFKEIVQTYYPCETTK